MDYKELPAALRELAEVTIQGTDNELNQAADAIANLIEANAKLVEDLKTLERAVAYLGSRLAVDIDKELANQDATMKRALDAEEDARMLRSHLSIVVEQYTEATKDNAELRRAMQGERSAATGGSEEGNP